MNKIKTSCALAIITLSLTAYASDNRCFEQAQTQTQINACAASDFKAADSDLNNIYHQMMNKIGNDQSTKNLLIAAQRKWVEFRDAECKFSTVRTADGSINSMRLNSCLADVTRSRISEFQDHLACGKNSDEQEAIQCAIPPAQRR